MRPPRRFYTTKTHNGHRQASDVAAAKPDFFPFQIINPSRYNAAS